MEDLVLLGIFLALIVLVLCFCAYNSNKSSNSDLNPDRDPLEVMQEGITGHGLIPGAPVYAWKQWVIIRYKYYYYKSPYSGGSS